MKAKYKTKLDRLEKGRSNDILALGHGKNAAGEDVFKTGNGFKTRTELEALEAAGHKVVMIDLDTRGL